ncbi:MAG: hypothetical protein ABIJ97_15825 [Bacteroidota bacterium]
MTKLLKYRYIIVFILTFSLFIRCEDTYDDETCYDYDYSDCNTIEPLEGNLKIDLTINRDNPEVEVIVFNGKPENLDTFTVEIVHNPLFLVVVPLNQYYSAKAKYMVDNNSVYVSDGDKIKSTSAVTCDSTCWDISGGDIDIRLKYDNF